MKKINLFNKVAKLTKSNQTVSGIKYDRKSGVIKKATVSGFESFELPPIIVTEERTLDVDGTSIEFGIADRIVVGAYAKGKAYGHKDKEKNMVVQTYEPIAVAAKLNDELRIIVSRKFARNAKKLEALVVYFNAYYLGNQVIRDGAIDRVKVAEDIHYIENPEYSGATIEDSAQYEQGKRMLAFIEAAAHSGATFTGIRVFGNNIGGVAAKIAKDENDKLLAIARTARADRKRDYKRMDQQAAEVASLEEGLAGLDAELDGIFEDEAVEEAPVKVTEEPKVESSTPVEKKQHNAQVQAQAQVPQEEEEVEG